MLVFDRAGQDHPHDRLARAAARASCSSPSALAVSAGRDASTSPTPATGGSCASRTAGTHLGSFGRFRAIRGDRRLARRLAASTAPTRRPTGSRSRPPPAATWRRSARPARSRASCAHPGGIAVDARRATCGSPIAATTASQAFTPDGAPLTAFGERGDRRRAVHRAGRHLRRLPRARDRRRLRQQPRPAVPGRAARRLRGAARGPEPAGPDPLQPARPARRPRSTVTADAHERTSSAIRQFPLRVSCDLPCKVAVVGQARAALGQEAPAVDAALLAAVAAGGQDGHGPPAAERAPGVRTLEARAGLAARAGRRRAGRRRPRPTARRRS